MALSPPFRPNPWNLERQVGRCGKQWSMKMFGNGGKKGLESGRMDMDGYGVGLGLWVWEMDWWILDWWHCNNAQIIVRGTESCWKQWFLQIVDLTINADASERTNRASGMEKVLAPYPTINRLNNGRASGIQEPTDKKVSSSQSSQESCRNVRRKNPEAQNGCPEVGRTRRTEWWRRTTEKCG